MTKAVTFGLNRVDPDAPDYAGWEGTLTGCVGDGAAIVTAGAQAGAECRGYQSGWFGTLTTFGSARPEYSLVSDATRPNFRNIMAEVAASPAGSMWFLWYSGHGSQTQYALQTVEGLCFYDGILEDTELWTLLNRVPEGVRLFLGLDCCHAGGMPGSRGPFNRVKSCPIRFRGVGLPAPVVRGQTAGNVAVWAGCRKDQFSLDGPHNGLFTATALSRLAPALTYLQWADLVRARMPSEQQPELLIYGDRAAWACPVFT